MAKKVVFYTVCINGSKVHECTSLAMAKALVYGVKLPWTMLREHSREFGGSEYWSQIAGIGCIDENDLYAFTSCDKEASKKLLASFKKSRCEVTDCDENKLAKKRKKFDNYFMLAR